MIHSRRNHLPFGRAGRVWTLLVVACGVAAATVLIVASAGGAKQSRSSVDVSAKAFTSAAIPSAQKVVDFASLPDATGGTRATNQRALPLMSPLGAAGLRAAKANAAANAPPAVDVMASAPARGKTSTNTPSNSFFAIDGLKNSPTVCPPSGCQPPDMGVAANSKYVMQAVNTSVAVWQIGKAKAKTADLIKFFGVPNPLPNGCTSIPFMSDPRLAYDPETDRFYAAALQVEGAFGVDPACNFVSRYWVAVSKSNKPSGKWNVYAINTAGFFAPADAADYTQMGFNGEAIFIGGNQFNNAGSAFLGAWTLALPKADMMAGAPLSTVGGFQGYTAGDGTATRLLDTVQPTISLGAGTGGPAGEILISSFNESITESKVVVVDFSNPIASGGFPRAISGVVVNTSLPYSQPPLADNPGDCSDCLETIDNRISATPVYMHGLVYASHDSAVNNGVVNANVHWMVVEPVLTQPASGCTQCSTITGGTSVLHDEYLTFGGESDSWFGVIHPDREGNLFLGFEFASVTFGVDPEGAFIGRRATATGWPDSGFCLGCSGTPTTNFRWGDYEAASFDGWNTNNVWIATQYSDATSGGDWGTTLVRTRYTLPSER